MSTRYVGTPIMALALVGMPINVLSVGTIGKIIKGGQSVATAAAFRLRVGARLTGGGDLRPRGHGPGAPEQGEEERRRQSGRCADSRQTDWRGCALGSAPERLSPEGYAAMIANTTQLNKPGAALCQHAGGAALDRHHWLRPRGPRSNTRRQDDRRHRVEQSAVHQGDVKALAAEGLHHRRVRPQLGGLRQGCHLAGRLRCGRSGAAHRSANVSGLLVSCDPAIANDVITLFNREGFESAAVVGRMEQRQGGWWWCSGVRREPDRNASEFANCRDEQTDCCRSREGGIQTIAL